MLVFGEINKVTNLSEVKGPAVVFPLHMYQICSSAQPAAQEIWAEAKAVQLHDILYRLSPDILYMVCSV
jgi:hypothetical protein